MKVYSSNSHPIGKATITLVHDTNQSFSGLYSIIKELEAGGQHAALITRLRQVESGAQKAVDTFYKFISDHPELPQGE